MIDEMKILTWNINGIRAVQREKMTLKCVLDSLGADIICLQETKVTRDMLDEPTAVVDGYESYFSFSRKKTGYSGTANYCKTETIPRKAEEGLTGKFTVMNDDTTVCHYGNMNSFSEPELQAVDQEGRCVITQHTILLPTEEVKDVAIINVYVPRAGEREDRHKYKLQFLTLLQLRAEAILKSGVHVIILGDLNLTHRKLDNCDPEADEEYLRKSSRIWVNRMLHQSEKEKNIPLTDGNLADVFPDDIEGGHFSDIFRRLHPNEENAFTNWCTMTGARQTNYGRRLDYILMDTELAKFATHCEIMSDFEGSDHCPVVMTLECTPIPPSGSPLMCSKFLPEFRGQQKKLSSFFTKTAKASHPLHKEEVKSLVQEKLCMNSSTDLASQSKDNNFYSLTTERLTGNNSLKRSSSANMAKVSKKAKLKKGFSDSKSKQISLTSFFTQKNKDKISNQHQSTQNSFNNINAEQTERNNSLLEDSSRITSSEDKIILTTSSSTDAKTEDLHQSPNLDCIILVDEENDQQEKLALPLPPQSPCKDSTSPASSQFASFSKSSGSSATAWKGLLKGLPPPPLCPGHKEPSLLRMVKKDGPNKNKQFYVCARPDGAPGNPESRCNFFKWLTKTKK